MGPITLRSVSAGYGDKTVIDSISCTMRKNRTTAIIGPGGSGKSTLLRLLASSQHGLPEGMWRRGELRNVENPFQILLQKPEPSSYSMAELLRYRYRGTVNARQWIVEAWQHVASTAAAHLLHHLYTPLALLAPALRRLAEFTLVVGDPSAILLIDEPELGAGGFWRCCILENLIASRSQRTILLVTHDLEIARQASDDTIFLLDGHIVEAASTQALFHSPRHPRTLDLITMGG